jgi:hypothetical protein
MKLIRIGIALLLAANAISWGIVAARNLAHKQLARPHVAPPTSAFMWVFPAPPDAPEASRIHLATSSSESSTILAWFDAHQTGWTFSSTRFSPDRTQFVSDTYGIELLEHRIVLAYQPVNDTDLHDHATVERPLSMQEQETWSQLVRQIRLTNRSE